jgi:superfamily II DNA or RNA helicase
VTQTLPLRKYQHEALDAVDRELASGILRTAVVLPTGTGKTVVFSHLIARQVDAGRRVRRPRPP